jgi:hypothetical protein
MAIVSMALALVGVLAFRSLTGQTETQPTSNEPTLVSHVHGLGVNPADGSLLAATHFGMFRLAKDGTGQRVSDSFQDTMGFTVIGPNQFLGSGHPDIPGLRAGQPPLLGLITSDDAGATWTPLSLSGEADFHGLVNAHDTIYGWNANTGQFMTSTDRLTWKVRSTLDMSGFAVDPAKGSHIIAATAAGVVESDDGGTSWQASSGPPVVVLSWDSTSTLWAADDSGALWTRVELEWQKVGTLPGTPEALLAQSGALYVAVERSDGRTGIYASLDSGRTWQERYQDPS